MTTAARPTHAAPRDASSFARPNTRTLKQYHVADEFTATIWSGACSGNPLDETLGRELADVPPGLRCQRPACRKHWPSTESDPS
jgi:hypothetical protein